MTYVVFLTSVCVCSCQPCLRHLQFCVKYWCGRDGLCWYSEAFKRALDRYCGLCITALYFLYISVVKGALSVFDCSKNEDGVRILDADPSIVCDQVCVIGLLQGVRGQGRAGPCHVRG
jgi:hypothetical protein